MADDAASGELKRLTIEAFTKADYSGTPVKFVVLFNPSTYSQKYEVEYHARQGAGDTGSPQVFGKIKPQEYAFELLFDGTGTAIEQVDVAAKLDEFLTVAGKHDSSIHRPKYLKLTWGKLLSRCVLKSANITYTLFAPDGTPLRARLQATFSENVEDALRVAKDRKNSPDLTHVHTVRAGEHLSELADRYYGEPGRYLQVAEYNRLANFRKLEVGQRVLFPPIIDRPATKGAAD
jgi:hypothetical protein